MLALTVLAGGKICHSISNLFGLYRLGGKYGL